MKITLLTPNTFFFSNNRGNSNRIKNARANNLAPLSADTVSFTGRIPKPATNTVVDFLEEQFVQKAVQLVSLADDYLAADERVAKRLAHLGFSFDRTYCELNPVKTKKSYRSKISRSKDLKVPDTIRDTVYCKDPYDLSKLDLYLKEKEAEGYVVAMEEKELISLMKRGYDPTEEIQALSKYLKGTKSQKSKQQLIRTFKNKGYDTKEVNRMLNEILKLDHEPSNSEYLEFVGHLNKENPNLDIRLDDVKDKIYLLPKKYQYCIGSPQKSGYEDIQIRFVRKSDVEGKSRKTPELHETIILFGRNYAEAKHRESERVYSFLRGFGELNIQKFLENKKYDGLTAPLKTLIDKVETFFRGEVSTKEFSNAKGIDYGGLDDALDITFNSKDEAKLEEIFDKIMLSTQLIYEKLKFHANTIGKNSLQKKEGQDLEMLSGIRTGLKDTIKTYQKEARLKSAQ